MMILRLPLIRRGVAMILQERLMYLRARDMNEIGLELFNHLCSLHIGQIQSQGYLVVKGKCESLRMTNSESKGFLGQLACWSFAVHRQNIHFIPRLLEKFEHLLESIGVS